MAHDFIDLGKKLSMPEQTSPRAMEEEKYYPHLHMDTDMELPDEGEAHIKFRKKETHERSDKGGKHRSHDIEVTHFKPLTKTPPEPNAKKGLSDALDAITSRKLSKAQAKEINQEEMDEED